MASIPNTQRKLREARFFYGKMLQEEGTTSLDREDFAFYLSAFVSAGRSVTFVLQSEHASYKNWFDSIWWKTLLPKESQLMNFMNGQRVAEVHSLGAETKEEVIMVPLMHALMGVSPLYTAYGDIDAPGASPAEIGQKTYTFEVNGKREKATDVCKHYLDLLSKLVEDFDKAFPK